jgi:hypothetical protein
VLAPVVARYRGKVSRLYFRADAAFAMPGVYEYLEAEGIKYAIRIPTNQVLQARIGYLLTRPVGRPPNHVRRFHASFTYQAGSWTKPRRVVAKVEWHPSELVPRVGFIVTNLSRPAERVVAFYNQRGTCEQWIKEVKLYSNLCSDFPGLFRWRIIRCIWKSIGHYNFLAKGLPKFEFCHRSGRFLGLSRCSDVAQFQILDRSNFLLIFFWKFPFQVDAIWTVDRQARPTPPPKSFPPTCCSCVSIR